MRAELAPPLAGAYVRAKREAGVPGAAIPLLGVKVFAEIRGFLARVTVRQRFRNAGDEAIEAVYVFPAPEKAAVTGLVIETGGRRIVGKVVEKEAAFDDYDEALAAGYSAALLDQHRPNVFQTSVGNLLPGQQMVVELVWVMELGWEGDALRFVLPTTVAPRYAPAEDRVGIGQTEAEKVNPPTAFEVPYGLEFTAEVRVPGGVAAVESPSHPLRWQTRGDFVAVDLSHEQAAMNEDLVVRITPREPREPWVQIEREADGPMVAALSLVPRLDAGPRAPMEAAFVIDRSGSMGGSSIDEARRALQLCLRGLREGDRFDIVGFGSTFASMFGESRPYTQENLDAASRWVETVDADMGGTEILAPLRAVLDRPAGGARREVILLTDGQVSNDAAVIELARRHAATTRIFTFGIGHGPSEHLINGVARASGGAAEFIKPGERIEPKVLRQFARLGTPSIENVRLEWDGAAIEDRAPYRLDRIFDGEPFLVYVRTSAARAGVVGLSGRLAGRDLRWELPVDPDAAKEGNLLAVLAARAEIRDLEEGTGRMHADGGSQQRRRREALVRQAIIDLGVRHQIASSQTSFLAVEVREGGEDQERGQLVLVPQELTRGWGHLWQAMGPVHLCMAPRLPSFAQARACKVAEEPRGTWRARGAPAYERLAMLQRADGSWLPDAALAKAIGSSLARLRKAARTIDGVVDAETIVATAAALVFLRTKAADAVDEWRALAGKAESWLDAALAGTKHSRTEIETLAARAL